MFQTDFPSIIRSSKLGIKQRYIKLQIVLQSAQCIVYCYGFYRTEVLFVWKT